MMRKVGFVMEILQLLLGVLSSLSAE